MHATLRPGDPPLSRSVEDYLKAIYHLSSQGGFASTSDIAAMLEVAPPSVSGMVKRLSETGVIEEADLVTIADAAVGAKLELRQVGTQDSARLRYFATQGLTPGVLLTVADRQPFNGPTTIALVPSGDRRVLGRELARLLLCSEVPVQEHGHADR